GRRLQFQYLDGAIRPIVFPTDDHVAVLEVMSVFTECSRAEFEFDAHTLPNSRPDLSLRLAVWKARPDRLHDIAKLATNHAKEKNHGQFGYRGMLGTSEINEAAVHARR